MSDSAAGSPRPRPTRRAALATAVAGAALAPAAAHAEPRGKKPHGAGRGGGARVRIATYNASLNRAQQGALVRDLSTPADPQARAVAEILQRIDADIVLINEFDHDDAGRAVDLFRTHYLERSQRGQPPVRYPYAFTAPVNTGVPSGLDLGRDGTVGGPDDAWGFGLFPGQYGMVLYSKHPIDEAAVRTFQLLRWAQMPGNLIPVEHYGAEIADRLRLSSKSHWDVPVRIGRTTLHVLVSHPTPPSFDGPEDRNGRRNHDEIRLWADYLRPGRASRWIVDDAGRRGGLAPSASFVILGDQNSDPVDGDSWPGAIDQLLDHPRIQDPAPTSTGAVEAAAAQGGANASHRGDPALDTADFSDRPAPGNLRVDYVLPSRDLTVLGSDVFWPSTGEAGAELIDASDHRPVHLDVRVR